MFYFALPLTAISLTFAQPALYALNPIYEIATVAVLFMTLKMFTTTIFSIFYQASLGIEKVDVNEKSTFRDYVKSNLFRLPMINIIKSIVYITGLSIILLTSIVGYSDLELVVFWTLIAFIVEIPFTLYTYFFVRKNFKLKCNKVPILKYILATTIIFIPMFFVTKEFLVYKISIFEFLPQLMIFVGISIGLYLIITYAIDNKTRKLVSLVIKELKDKNKTS